MYVSISVFTTYILNDEPFIPTCADLICCDGSGCNKAYHATCAGIEDIKKLPETWYCPSCTIRSRISANNVQSQSKMPPSPSAKQEAGSTAADTTVSSPDVPISIDVKKDTAYEDDTDDFESCKSSQSSQAQVDHKPSDTKNTKNDEDDVARYGDNILARYGNKVNKEGASANNNSDNCQSNDRQSNDDMNDTATSSTNNQEAGSADFSSTTAVSRSAYINNGTSISSNNVNRVIVQGCGVSDVNGTYLKVVGQGYKGAPVYSQGNYAIHRDLMSKGPNSWYIGYCGKNVSSLGKYSNCYGSPNNADSINPPTDGWVALNDWVNPAPKLHYWQRYKAKEKWDKNKDYMRYPNP